MKPGAMERTVSELLDEHIRIYGLVSHPRTRAEKFKKCDVDMVRVLKRVLSVNIAGKLFAGSCAEGRRPSSKCFT